MRPEAPRRREGTGTQYSELCGLRVSALAARIRGMRKDDDCLLSRWATALALAAMLLVAYPLSMGPMYWLCTDSANRFLGDFKGNAFLVFYEPVITAYQDGPEPIRKVIGLYLGFWEK